MNVIKQSNTILSCDHCNCISNDSTAFKVHINDTVIVLCEECKHELTFELISN